MEKVIPSLDQRQRQAVESFRAKGNWLEKYEYLIKLGQSLTTMKPEEKNENNLVKGCQSRVWIAGSSHDGNMIFAADSDTMITKGLLALMLTILNHQPAEAIVAADMSFIESLGLKQHLSPSRSNGLLAMLKQMQTLAQEQLSTTKHAKQTMANLDKFR